MLVTNWLTYVNNFWMNNWLINLEKDKLATWRSKKKESDAQINPLYEVVESGDKICTVRGYGPHAVGEEPNFWQDLMAWFVQIRTTHNSLDGSVPCELSCSFLPSPCLPSSCVLFRTVLPQRMVDPRLLGY